MTNDVRQLDYPRSLTEAKSRYELFYRSDPLPEVAPALLNSGDIHDYARITGMVYPFETDNERLKQKLKPASYEIDFLGTASSLTTRVPQKFTGLDVTRHSRCRRIL